MTNLKAQINDLLRQVEQYHVRPIRTTVDFEALSTVIEHQTSERISASTLKRMWGYVNDRHSPRRYTLDVLSKYIGARDFGEFCEKIDAEGLSDSDFFSPFIISSNETAVGYLFYASMRVEESVAAKVAGSVTDMVTTTVEGMVVGEVSDRVTNNLTDKVSDNVTTKVTDIVTNNLEGIVSEKVEGRDADVVTEKVEGMVTEKVTDKVTDKVTEKVTSNVTERVTEYLIPSPEVDEVSEEEFGRREALCQEFFKALDAYTVKMQMEIYNLTCIDEKLPDFKELKPNYAAECEKLLESMLSSIESSSLYPYARREMKSKTDEYIKITKDSFLGMFWMKSEMEYAKAKDSIAAELRKIPQPKKAENFSELSFE
ncbi:MAG: hypothetical protein R3Y61_05330 [Rikenellaceae bacterium]